MTTARASPPGDDGTGLTPTVREALEDALATVRRHREDYVRTAVALQVLTALVAGPAVTLLLRAALGAAGVASLTEASLTRVLTHPVAVLLLLVLAVVASLAVLVQHAGFVLLGRGLARGHRPSAGELAGEALAAARRALGPGLAPFVLYAFVLVPVGGLSLAATLTRAVEVPPFIAGELQKTPAGTAAVLALLAIATLLNLRLVLVPTLLLTTPARPARAFAASWRLTRGRWVTLGLLLAAVWLGAATLVGALAAVVVVPTRVSDAAWPAVSPLVAGLTLTGVEVVLVVVGGLVVAVVTELLVQLSGPPGVEPRTATGAGSPAPADRPHPGRRPATALLAVVVVVSVAGNTALVGASAGTTTRVVAHRGATYEAVENTLESLEAAAALGADVVELDVLEAGDGGLVVVHDTNLRRIAGVDRDVFAMTTAELAGTTVRQGGHVSTIPTFEEFAARAAALDVALLVELKAHGHERGDVVGEVAEILREHDLAATSMVQAFDPSVAAEVEARFPEVDTGWVVAYSRGRLDTGGADFVTLEQTSYSPRVLREAHEQGAAVYLWTVTDPLRMRAFVRDGVDGLITGYPSRALEQRAAVAAETGLARRLEDTVRALVDW